MNIDIDKLENHESILALLDEMGRDLELSEELSNIVARESPFDSPNFSAIEYVNKKFPTEESLVDLDTVIDELNSELVKLDVEIAQTVRDQARATFNLQDDLQQLKLLGNDIQCRLESIRNESKMNEVKVEEVSRDVRSLDRGKQNLTLTIASLKRLAMLISGLDQLRRLAAEREYKEVMNLVLATCELVSKFKDFEGIEEMEEVLNQHKTLLEDLRAQIIEDFDSLFDPDSSEPIPKLFDAANAADAMPGQLRSEILSRFVRRLLEPYERLFSISALTPKAAGAALEEIDRRFSWLKRVLREFDPNYGQHFPATWSVPCLISVGFCRITREHLIGVLSSTPVDPAILVRAFQKCRDFEQYLVQTFQNITPGSSAYVAELLKDLERRDNEDLSSRLESPTLSQMAYPEVLEGNKNAVAAETDPGKFRFPGIISECFDGYLAPWIVSEEQRLMGTLSQATAPQTESVIGNLEVAVDPDGGPRLIYSSVIDLLAAMKSSLKKCTQLRSDQTLDGIFRVFKKVLRQYIMQLSSRLPKNATLTSDSHKIVCAVLGTSEYIDGTLPHIIESVITGMNDQSQQSIEFDGEKDALWSVKSRAMTLLVGSLQTPIDQYLTGMSAQNWTILQEVGDESSLIKQIETTLTKEMAAASRGLSPSLYRLFCDTFVQWIVTRFNDAVYGCEQISPLGAQQLLLDTRALRTKLLEIPVISAEGGSVSTVYTKIVMRELGRVEVLLKILTSSASSPETLQQLLIENAGVSSKEELRRVLRLRVGTSQNSS